MAEQPTIEEPKVEPKSTETPESAAQDILNKLKDLGIDSPDKVDGMATASREAGNLANQLGTARQELADLRAEMKKSPTPPTEYNEYNEGVDLGSAIQKELGIFMNNYQQKQTQAQQEYLQTMNDISTDADYKMVEDIWNKHCANPKTQLAVQTGQTTPKDEYNKLVRTFYRESLKQSKSVLEGLVSGKPTTIPHMESSDTQSIPLPSVNEEQKQKIKDKTDPKKGFSGTDEDIVDLVKEIMPQEDSFYQLG